MFTTLMSILVIRRQHHVLLHEHHSWVQHARRIAHVRDR
jgi:hypothetical protein